MTGGVDMLQTYEAVLENNGHLHFVGPAPTLAVASKRVLVIVDDAPATPDTALCGARLSEPALATDWLRDEEDAAWQHLQAQR
jgi:hypothetical protein